MKLNQHYLYLALDLLTILFPFIFSFYPKANFSKKWKYLGFAILAPGIFFLVWDGVFTQIGVWGFNPTYLSGINIGNLPLEEVLFFVCIPYACVFTYEAFNYLIRKDYFQPINRIVSGGLVAGCSLAGILHYDKWYTLTAMTGLAIYIFLVQFVWKAPYMGRFYFMFLIILIPFFIVNGILTGSWIDQPIVWYNNEENMGLRIGTIPAEDIFYGMLLLLMNVSVFEWLQHRR